MSGTGVTGSQEPAEHWAIIALGSNLGDSISLLTRVFDQLETLSAAPLVRSSLWRSSPVDCPPGSPDFVNAVAGLVPTLGETPESLLGKLQEMERSFGRRPKVILNEARVLDLDLITFQREIRRHPDLCLPHPRAHQRRFVLEPLAEIAPALTWPGQTATVRELLSRASGQQRLERILT